MCLDKLYEKKPYTGGSITIDSELAKDIYFKVLNYATMKDKPSTNRYFSELFDKGILGYFEKIVMRDYGNDIDIDIITAIENESIYELGYDKEENANELIEQYVKKVIANTRALLNALEVSSDMVLTDVLETGYTVKNSILNEKLAKLAPEDRSKIYEVIDTLLKHSKQIAP